MKNILKSLVFILSVVVFAALSGCAGSTPTAEFKKPISGSNRLCMNDDATVKLIASDGVVLNESNRLALENRLLFAINDKKYQLPCLITEKRNYVLNGKITRYEEGNAFLRAMLVGLGQIHIDGEFVLTLMPDEKESVAEFNLSKTFAWGGIYGAVIHIKDVEPAFAEGVAEAIVVQKP